MPCYRPLSGYYSRKVNESGKRSLVFSTNNALVDVKIPVPCGRCIGCRLDRSLSWAVRCMHEASLYQANCFITLTFNDSSVTPSLKVSDFQNFMKRLRQKIFPSTVRFFHCGEYGAKFSRPHHHACLFGYDFPDKKIFKRSVKGAIFTSEILSSLWPYGFSTVGDVTFESASYVARYVLKKWSADNMKGGELYEAMRGVSNAQAKKAYYNSRHPEYITMSRRPGIGSFWYDKFKSDIFTSGFVVLPGGKKVKIPKFYDSKFELDNLVDFAILKTKRIIRAEEDAINSSPARLAVREEVKLLQSNNLIRGFENGS